MPLTSTDIALGSLLAIALAFRISQFVCRSNTFYKSAINKEIASARFHALDGLRGFLAIGVVLHHIYINHHFYQTGTWELTTSRLSTFLGRGSVAMFFMITAFLFWGRLIESKGGFDTIRFFENRVRRIAPMYLVSAGLVVVTALALTHFRLDVPLRDLFVQIASWLLFTFPGVPPINGFAPTPLINTVFWSLTYEWKFYLLLPLLGALTIRWGTAMVAFGTCACIALFSSSQVEWYFIAGCASAMALRISSVQRLCNGVVPAVVAICCTVTAIYWQPLIYSAGAAALLWVTFLIIAGGNTLFGLLANKAARLLGLLSYSIYLLHNWVLYLASRLLNHIVPIASLSHLSYISFGASVVGMTVLLASLTYRYIEFPLLQNQNVPVAADCASAS
ncbi:peptidoglycan/LPS O-acetylase OafA/YrhL [Paraburkholderia bannensis]|uniref:Peptidoglycan/LPS O-acetylase OafA/YrhL n=1 Tax=Paraburkholderia bannensis TaxID=765414 RepID=A0A7W9WRC2_9BURK|nr:MULTISPECIES: acyltransferase [Paraburkholderia]MBB3258022.1 peptidoglycan/LPS O-acetylase OafA/YrhL [Paraburkholderia sp. WP4_3_2]MBB6103035.1 peptidoglycan/LPS O-acetylase OafA/YrhL [Paraburkholderia bannensis]